ncbi:MAG: SBBP repeat-containing protein, partial [Planctomycetes bacterium]|nr:SBBP repeat-containing protein [Planctomycetota bacterium]
KYGSDGSLIWVKRWGGNFKDTAYGVSVDSLGDVYVTGVTSSFGSSGSAFLLTYTSSGDLQRAMIWDGTLSDKGYSIASDTYCIFVAGSSQNGSTQGAWQNVAGTSATVFGNPEDIIGITADISSGVESGGITGAEISLTGLENGAGGDDSLLLRLRK